MDGFRMMAGSIAGAMLVVSAAYAAAGGTIVKLDGKAEILRQGQKVSALESLGMQAGDTLNVGDESKVQLHFEDDSVFSVASHSSFKVEEFRMPRQGAGGAAVFSLGSGGVRTMSGLIGKSARDKYEMRTHAVTIGGHGASSYAVLICADQCAAKGHHQPGVYVRDDSGVVVLSNSAGHLSLSAGQTAYVAGMASPPVRTKDSPFNDPQIAAAFVIDADFHVEVNPPRIEPPPPASPF